MPKTRCATIASVVCSTCAWARLSTKHAANRPTRLIALIGRAEQQRAALGRVLATIKRRYHLAPLDHFITEQVAAKLCRHRGTPLRQLKSLWYKSYAWFRAPMHLLAGRVEEGRGDRLRQLRLPSPLVKPDVRISRIRLSDWLHRRAHGGGPKWTRRR